MILFEKYNLKTNELLDSWTRVFDNVKDLIDYLSNIKDEDKKYLVSDGYKIVIRGIGKPYKKVGDSNE